MGGSQGELSAVLQIRLYLTSHYFYRAAKCCTQRQRLIDLYLGISCCSNSSMLCLPVAPSMVTQVNALLVCASSSLLENTRGVGAAKAVLDSRSKIAFDL